MFGLKWVSERKQKLVKILTIFLANAKISGSGQRPGGQAIGDLSMGREVGNFTWLEVFGFSSTTKFFKALASSWDFEMIWADLESPPLIKKSLIRDPARSAGWTSAPIMLDCL